MRLTLPVCFLLLAPLLAAAPPPRMLNVGEFRTADDSNGGDLEAARTTTTAPSNTTTRFVPLDQWHCGSNDFDKWLAHETIKGDCPARMEEANNCCLVHDNCYMEDKTRAECDGAFCRCLDDALALNAKCRNVAATYCTIVEMFGASAHENSKDYVKTSTTTTTTTTTTPVPPSSSADRIEKQLFKQLINTKLDAACYDGRLQNLSSCVAHLDECPHDAHVCAYEMCGCARRNLRPMEGAAVGCRSNFHAVCGFYLPGDEFLGEIDAPFWTERYLGLTLPQTIFVALCLLIAAGTLVFWSVRYARRQFEWEPEKRPVGFVNDAASASSSTSSFYAADRPSMNSIPLLK
ncbi:hypothetical protein M3Y99_01583600 [Aphelenchoides fujianensis]|nr:hypothetical protein M3Y99_01583600 [Aphelenchoides fujianensis]